MRTLSGRVSEKELAESVVVSETEIEAEQGSVLQPDITKPLLIYLASPYRAETDFGVLQNINNASKIASELWGIGHYCFCPVMNSAMMHRTSHASAEHFLEGDLVMLSKCDGIVMSPDWETSEGAKGEYAYAQEKGMLTWIWPSVPPPPENVSGD